MIPGSLITFLGLVYILLDKGTGERTDFLATILLTEVMFLVMMASLSPVSQYVPYMTWLFFSYVILLALMELAVLIIDKLYEKQIKNFKLEEVLLS